MFTNARLYFRHYFFAFLICLLATSVAFAREDYANKLQAQYGAGSGVFRPFLTAGTNANYSGTDTRCTQCHPGSAGGARNDLSNYLQARSISTSTSAAQIAIWIESQFSPAAAALNETVPQSTTPTVSVSYDVGEANQSATTYSVSQLSFVLGGANPANFSINQTTGALTGIGLVAGSSYSVTIIPTNPSGFFPIGTKVRTASITVNRRPTSSGTFDLGTFTDNDASFLRDLITANANLADADGDTLNVRAGSLSVSGVGIGVDNSACSLTNSLSGDDLTISPGVGATNDLVEGESCVFTISYIVEDTLNDSVAASMTVRIDGVTESGANTPADVSARTLTLSEDGVVPTSTNLTQDDSGMTFTDANLDVLSVDSFLTSLSGFPQFSLAGDVFSVVDLTSYQSLAAGETDMSTFSYLIKETRNDSMEEFTTLNTLRVTINGVNDPVAVTSTAITDSVNESIILESYDLIALTGATDPDASDEITATNLRDIVTSAALRNPELFKISDDGKKLEVSPAFSATLDEGATGSVTAKFDLIDGNGSTQEITFSLTITGVEAGHGASAGLYANSLQARYPLAGFQAASSQPAACFTCHTPAASLFSSKPDCTSSINFTSYGRRLCEDDRGGPFGPRLARAEAAFAPAIIEPAGEIRRYLSSDAGATDADPIQTDPGKTVDGVASSIESFYLEDDMGGAFVITSAGLVQATRSVDPGVYEVKAYPRNISGSKDAGGSLRDVAGFYPLNRGLRTITIEVTETLPVVADDTGNTEESASVILEVVANDSDGGRVREIAIASNPANGAVSVGDDLAVTYTPSDGFTGTDTFTYTASNLSGVSTRAATVTIEVIAGGGLVARNDTATTATGRAVSVNVLGNDVNAQNGSTQVTLVSVPDVSTVGSTSVAGQNILFTPVAGFTGNAVIVYAAQNVGRGGSQAQLTIQVMDVGTGAIAAALDDPELKKTAIAFETSCTMVAGSNTLSADNSAFLATCANLNAAATANEDLQQAIRALQNEENLATISAVQTVARGLGRVVSSRLANIRRGRARGFDFSGVNINLGGERFPTEVLVAMAQSALGSGNARFRSSSPFATVSPVWGGFISGDFSYSEKDAVGASQGYDLKVANLTVGVDYAMTEGRTIGVAVGYSQTETEFSGGGSLDGEAFQATVYGVVDDFLRPGLTFEGFISVGNVKFTSARRILFTAGGATVDAVANASFDAQYLNVSPRLSYTNTFLNTGDRLGDLGTALSVTWFAQLDYLVTHLNGYSETGGAGLALSTQSQTYQSLLLSLGVELARPIYVGPTATAEVFGSLSLNGELLDRTRSLTSSFAVAGPGAPTFTVSEPGAHGIGGSIEFGTAVSMQNGTDAQIVLGHDFTADGVKTNRISISWSKTYNPNERLAFGFDRSVTSRDSGNWDATLDYDLQF